MTHDIQTSLLCGDIPPKYEIDVQSLGLVDFAFVPHLGRYATITELAAYSKQNHIRVYACPDNAGIVVEDERIQCIGNVVIIQNGVVLE